MAINEPTALFVDWAGCRIALPDMSLKNRRLVTLQGLTDISTFDITFHENGNDYQVPAGKNATILGIYAIDGTAPDANFVTIFYADNVNGNINQVNLQSESPPAPLANQPDGQYYVSALGNIPSSKYINHVATNTNKGFWNLLILEEDN